MGTPSARATPARWLPPEPDWQTIPPAPNSSGARDGSGRMATRMCPPSPRATAAPAATSDSAAPADLAAIGRPGAA
jgi:hypothetical protein